MAATDDYLHYVLEQLAPVGRVNAARFFGGIGLARGSVQFAMVMSNTLYFVVDDTTRARYEAAGMEPFAYDTRRRRVEVRRYFAVPESVLDDPEVLREWAEEALRVAARPRKRRS